jgi:hypothetical protein
MAVPRLCRATVYRKGIYWICSGYGDIIQSVQNSPHTFSESLTLVPATERWCTEWLDVSDEGVIVADAIRNHAAIAVSDGSYKEEYGTAAWVIEGDSAIGRILGRVIVPGGAHDHSSYRSELAGILAIMTITNKLCDFYDIDNGSVEIACDGRSALDKAFSHTSSIRMEDSHHDILGAIRYQWAQSKILWKARHVYGHQDEVTPATQLDRWATLNIEMDELAKLHMHEAIRRPRHYLIEHEPWSLWFGGKKITKNLSSTLYDLVHAEEAKQYWLTKESISEQVIQSTNWEAIGKAMTELPRTRRVFLSKHVVGMCGVGKFMVRWKQRDSAACPRCGEFEDAPHVWICKAASTYPLWDKALQDLEDWMTTVDTDPDIQSAILHYLRAWRDNISNPHDTTAEVDSLVQQQSIHGWRLFFEGWTDIGWEETQQLYYSFLCSRRTGRRWVIALIKKMWQIAWDLWEHRNGILHEQQNAVSADAILELDRKLSIAYYDYRSILLGGIDRHLFSLSLSQLLQKDVIYRKTWLHQVELAMRNIRQRGWVRRNSSSIMLLGMQRGMRQWLSSV